MTRRTTPFSGGSVRLVLTVLAFVLVVSATIAAPAMGQATPTPTPTENGSRSTPANGSASETATERETGPDVQVQTLAPNNTRTSTPGANRTGNGNGSATATANATNSTPGSGSSGSGGGGFGFGIPSTSEIAGEAVNGTLGALNRVFVDTVGTILRLPWRFITVRFAPFDAVTAVGDGDGGLWQRPPGVYGRLYDLATGWAFEIAVSLLAIFFLVDWVSNLSPQPGTIGPIDRIFLRGGDVAHELFSWPIAWAHFLLASILCAIFLPPDEVVVSGLTDYYSQLVGIGALVGFTLVFSIVLAIAGGYLLLKHAGAFVYLLVGLVAYPILVAAGIPDHPVVGRLGEFAENAREGYVVSAWYPVPTAFVIGVGYTIDQAVLAALTLGGPLGEIGGGAIYYPTMWLAALYAPEKVFKDGGVARQAKNATLAAGAGGAAGAATGSAAGAGAGASSGAGAGAASGSASALPAGAGSGAAGALTSGAGSTASRMASGSPGASALADGGTQAITSASGGSDSTGPLGTGNTSANGTGGGTGSVSGAESSTARAEPDGLNRIGDRSEFDTGQRYDPLIQSEEGDLRKVAQQPPRDANWIADKGGFDRLDQATDDPLYFRGESDGELYGLRGAAETGGVHDGTGSGSDGGSSTGNDRDSIRGI